MSPRGRRQKGRRLANLLLGGVMLAVTALALSAWWEARRGNPKAPPDPRLSDGSIAARVEIWNGSGFEGAGGRMASRLREAGFQVVDVRNADRFDYPVTLVVDRTADGKAAREVSRALSGARILRQRRNVDWEVTVVVGRDWRERS